jgi:glycosyltransferase involved in cell wall biosynthesis
MRVLAVTNIYPTESYPESGTFVEQQVRGLRHAGVDVSVLFVDRRTRGVLAYAAVPWLVASALAGFDADIVHVMYGGVLADLVTRRVNDRPTVVTFHGSDLLGGRSFKWIKRWMAAYGVVSSRRAATRAKGIVVVAPALEKTLPEHVDRRNVRIIPCGIDLSRFRPLNQAECRAALNWRPDRFHVLFNRGGDDPVKRRWLARAAVEELNRGGVDAELHELHGVRNDMVPVWLNASDAVLLTSLHEGSPTIVKEALACTVPVVSVDVGDVRERFAGIDGCHIALDDPRDLADKLRRVFGQPRRAAAVSHMRELSIERSADRLCAFYRELMPAGRVDAHSVVQNRDRLTCAP